MRCNLAILTGMALHIAVVGGGWYGCHIAAELLARGNDVRLFEQHGRLFHEASGNNQFRLHLGFHYPRHAPTRLQSRDGFSRFLAAYPTLSQEVAENFYAVATGDSRLDSASYHLVMRGSGLDLAEACPEASGLRGVDAVWRTDERVLLLDRARAHFSAGLAENVQFGVRVDARQAGNHVLVGGRRFDLLVDASWGHLTRPPMSCIFEPTLLLYYAGPVGHPAITLVDGPLCSIYPTDQPGLFTLSSVAHTPLGCCDTAAAARAIRDGTDAATIGRHRVLMEAQISRYLPDFSERFRYLGPQLAIKTKPVGPDDDRAARVFRMGRVIAVMSGKIDTVFHAADRVLDEVSALTGVPQRAHV